MRSLRRFDLLTSKESYGSPELLIDLNRDRARGPRLLKIPGSGGFLGIRRGHGTWRPGGGPEAYRRTEGQCRDEDRQQPYSPWQATA